MNIYDNLLLSLCNPHREKLAAPSTIEGITYASDGYFLVAIPEGLHEGVYPPLERGYNFPNIVPAKETEVRFTAEILKNAVSRIPLAPIYDNCKQCEGEGVIVCHCCDYENECKDCGGTGNGKKIGEELDERYDIQFTPGGYISPKYVQKLVSICESENSDCIFLAGGPDAEHLFQIGSIQVVIARRNFSYKPDDLIEVYTQGQIA